MDENLRKAYKIVEESTGDINLSRLELTCLPNNIPKVVNGDFDCYENKLTSLKNSPEIVNGGFYCWQNELTSLTSGPKIVNGNFSCYRNQLKSLEGAPKIVKGNFFCYINKLNDFTHLTPFIGGRLYYDGEYKAVDVDLLKRNSLQKGKTLWMKI